MNLNQNSIKFLCAALTASVLLTGCSSYLTDSSDADTTSTLPSAAEDGSSAAGEAVTNVSNLSMHIDVPYSIDPTTLFTERDLGTAYTVDTEITLDGTSASAAGEGVSIDGSTITITAEGVYRVSGTLSDGCLVVNAPDAKVQIVLDNVTITNTSGTAIYVADAKKVFLTLADGSANVISDSSSYADTSDDAPDAAIYSKDSLTINGTGSLAVNGNFNEGITSKDDLVITGGKLNVSAVGNGIKGKDYVAVAGGDITVKADGDGIKSNNAIDAGMGFVYICGGSFIINAEGDGIQAETELVAEGGTFDITAGGGTVNAPAHTDDFGMGGGMPGGMGGFGKRGNWTDGETTDGVSGGFTGRGGRGGWDRNIQSSTEGVSETNGDAVRTANTAEQSAAPDGEMPSAPNGEMPTAPDGEMPSAPDGEMPEMPADGSASAAPGGNADTTTTETASEDDSTVSIKGMKAGTLLYIGGEADLTVNAADDALHSNGDLFIADGTVSLAAGSKGVHADTNAEISGGTLTVTESYEGIEAAHITVSGGDLKITSSDDGFNASDGSSQGAMGGAVDASLTISGGNVYVDAGGDGLDSNGELLVSGGTVYVDGPTNSGNGALDSNSSLTCTGGLLVAVGASGMAEYPDGTQETIVLTTTQTQAADTKVVITDANGSEILTFTPSKTWNSFIISSPDLTAGETYTFTLNGEEAGTVTLDDTVSFIGEAGGMMGGGMMGGRGGQMGGNFDPDDLPDDFDPSQFGGDFNPDDLPEDFDPSQMQPPTNEDGSFSFPQGGGQRPGQDGTTTPTQYRVDLDVNGKELIES